MIRAMDEAEAPTIDQATVAVEEQFGIMFTRVRSSMRARAARVHPQLQPAGYKILTSLLRGGPTHAGALVEHLATDKSVVSRQLRLLEELGLVEREVDPADRRAQLLAATELARNQVAEIRRKDQGLFYSRLRAWPLDDVRMLAELLGRLNRDAV